MKFIALLKKDLREALPWTLLAAVIMLLFGSMIIHFTRAHWWESGTRWQGHKGAPIDTYWLINRNNPMHDISPLIFCLPLALGLVLGVRQFWVPNFDKTWAFCLHRRFRSFAL